MNRPVDDDQLGPLLLGHQRFRLEALPNYAVDDDGGDFQRWLSGQEEPTWERKRPWMDVLHSDRSAGRGATRVRILSDQLTDYERYACEWGYLLNVEAGEDIRILRRHEHNIPESLIERDFWIVDGVEVVLMNYDEHGQFTGAEIADEPDRAGYYLTRDLAWAAAEPFTSWWRRHQELHRMAA